MLPVRQDVIFLSKSVQESLFPIKRNVIFLNPSKSNATCLFLRSFHKDGVIRGTVIIILNSHVHQFLYY